MATIWSTEFTWETHGKSWDQDPLSVSTSQRQTAAGVGNAFIEGEARTGHGPQEVVGHARIEKSGSIVSSQAQSAAGDAALVIQGPATAGQDTAQVAGDGELLIAGPGESAQRAGDPRGFGKVIIAGRAATAGGRQRTSGRAVVSIRGSASTGQVHQEARGLGSHQRPEQFRDVWRKLLKYPHRAVFDLSPDEVTALRFTDHDAALEWRVSGYVLEVRQGGLVHSYGLEDQTVGVLHQRLINSGFAVELVDREVAPLSAMVLIQGGEEWSPVLAPLKAFRSILWALMYAYAREVAGARYQIGQALRQMVIPQAEGLWLDLWAALYGVEREPGEGDGRLAPRIPREAFRQRVNAFGIEQAIRDATGWDVRIEEPWKEIFTLDQSVLSGPDRTYDGAHVGYHLIRPVATQSVDWLRVNRIIDRNRAAGVLVVDAETRRTSSSSALGSGEGFVVEVSGSRTHTRLNVYQDRALLDFGSLEDTAVPNNPAIHTRLDGMFRRSQSFLGGVATLDNAEIEERSVPNDPAIARRSIHLTSEAELAGDPVAFIRHRTKDENERRYSQSIYSDRRILDFSEIEDRNQPVDAAVRRVEVLRVSESIYSGQSWDVGRSWLGAASNWADLREVIDFKASRLS